MKIEVEVRTYMRHNTEENMSWCRPYISGNGRVSYAVNESGVCGLCIDGKIFDDVESLRSEPNSPVWRKAALAAGADLNETWFDGVSDTVSETSCFRCPFFDKCGAMDERMVVVGSDALDYDEDEIEDEYDEDDDDDF